MKRRFHRGAWERGSGATLGARSAACDAGKAPAHSWGCIGGCRGCETPCPFARGDTSTFSGQYAGVFCMTLAANRKSRQARGLRGRVCRDLFCNFWRYRDPEKQNPPWRAGC
jgi:hypothetical protein